MKVRPAEPRDREWIEGLAGAARVASCGRLWQIAELPGLVAERDGEPLGAATYRIEGGECELVTLDSDVEGAGAGSALIEAVAEIARAAGCSRLFLITTNDNLHALRFYQRRGLRLTALRPGAVDEARRTLKPEIPAVGRDRIPIRDELELELPL